MICEVKEFTTTALTERLMQNVGRAVAVSYEEEFGAVRNAISGAAAQLKPLRDRGEPLAVVLANPHLADVNLEIEEVVYAMYGNPGIQIQFDDQGNVAHESAALLRDGALTAKHRYLGAVITLHRRSDADDHIFARVLSTISAATGEAVPVSRDLFNGPHDEYWAMDAATGKLERA